MQVSQAGPIDLGNLELPSFPQITMTALEMARDDDSSLADLADVLATDPGLSVVIMKTVNSAAYGCRQQVRNIHHAVSLLGRNEIEAMLIAAAVKGALPMSGVDGLDPARFWGTAAKRAATAKLLAQELDPSTASESFTAALLQDMAVPVLLQQQGRLYADVVASWHGCDTDLAQLERMSFQWDHALVGAQMGQHWQFPEDLVHAIGSHHGTDGGVFRALPAVALVSALREVDEELGRDRLVAAAEGQGIASDVTVDILDRAFESAGEMARLFGY